MINAFNYKRQLIIRLFIIIVLKRENLHEKQDQNERVSASVCMQFSFYTTSLVENYRIYVTNETNIEQGSF